MKQKFYCLDCDVKFQAIGNKVEYRDPLLGACWKKVAVCPKCGGKADEVKSQLLNRGNGEAQNGNASCPTGTCPFMS